MRGHWLDRLPAMDDDIADMEKLLNNAANSGSPGRKPPEIDLKIIKRALRTVVAKSASDENPPAILHEPSLSFQRREPLPIIAQVPDASHPAGILGLRLRYRHVNQGEDWRSLEMERVGNDYRMIIAEDYTDTPFPLQYYFQIRDSSGKAWLHPGLKPGWHGQPYYFVRQRA
jgi:hypothetical protein